MGQWVFFHTMHGWQFNTWKTPYAAAHDAALADFVAETSAPRVGQDTTADKWYIFRAGLHFYTDDLPDEATISSASIALSQAALPIGQFIPLLAGFNLCVVEGSGLHAPAIDSDFGYLLDKTTPFGTLWIPQYGLVHETYYDAPLNADGINAINRAGWTRYGLRSSDDIDSNTDHALDDYLFIELRGSPFFTGLTRTVSAEPSPDSAILTGLLSEEGLTRKHIKLVVDVAEAGNFSNIDVRFWYRNTATGAEDTTPWKEHQGIEVPFSIEVSGLAAGTYQYRAQSRILLEDDSYKIFSGEIKTFSIEGAYSQCSNVEDGYVAAFDPDWDTAHDAASGDELETEEIIVMAMYYIEMGVAIARGFLPFDTSDILPEATLISAILALYPVDILEEEAGFATLHVVEGVQASPLEPEDYGRHLDKVLSAGSIAFGDWVPDSYNEIELDLDVCRDWIIKGGITKFCLRVAADKNDTPLTVEGDNGCFLRSAESGPDYCPKLIINYSLPPPVVPPTLTTDPATDIETTSATLKGTLVDDGGEPCGCGFEWGETEAYEHGATPPQSKTTGQEFSQAISGLDPNTTYHFRAFATNSAGTSYGADRTFMTHELLIVNKSYALGREEL